MFMYPYGDFRSMVNFHVNMMSRFTGSHTASFLVQDGCF